MKEKLIEILMSLDAYNNEECERCYKECDDRCFCEKTADYLIANGVYVSEPCDVKPSDDWVFTNADRIRAMSDEDMIVFAKNQIGCGFDYFPCGVVCEGKCESYDDETCRGKIMNWLKQSVEN